MSVRESVPLPTEEEPAEPLYTVRQVADHLQCGRRLVYAFVRDGSLRAVHLGRLVRVPQSALEEFIAAPENRTGP